MHITRTATAIVGVAVVAGIAGCTGPSVPTDPDTIGGTVQLWYLEDPDTEFMPAIKAGFEEKYPGTTVELTELPEDGFVTKIDTALLAQQPPDVSFVYESRWIKAGDVLPLTETIEEYDIDTASMNQVALSECLYEDQLYCLGTLTGSVMLVYNKDLFDEAGVEYPSTDVPMTIDEFDDMARRLASALDGTFGSVIGAPFFWTDRSTHFSADGTETLGYVDDEATIHMYEVIAALSQDGINPVPAETELVLPADMLGAGDAAMAVTDTEYAAAILAEAGYRWGVAPPPVEQEGDLPFVFVGTDKYGVFSDSRNPTTAEALVAYMATEGNRLRVEVSDKPPLDSRLLDSWAGDDEGRQEVKTVLSLRSAPGLFVPGFWEVTAPIDDAAGQMMNGEAEPREAIGQAAPVMQERLDREWDTWNNIR